MVWGYESRKEVYPGWCIGGYAPLYASLVPWWSYYPVYTLPYHPGYTPYIPTVMTVLVYGACMADRCALRTAWALTWE